jgi:hypothetical protein
MLQAEVPSTAYLYYAQDEMIDVWSLGDLHIQKLYNVDLDGRMTMNKSRDSSVGIATRLRAGRSGF